MSKGYQNKWVGGVSQARTIGNRLIASMSSADQLNYLGKTFVDYDDLRQGGSHGGSGGVYTKQSDISAYGYGDFRALLTLDHQGTKIIPVEMAAALLSFALQETAISKAPVREYPLSLA